MAFYDMYPMGSGGMSMGGMPLGGALPKQYLTAGDRLRRQENPIYTAMRDKASATRTLKKDAIDNRIMELIQEAAAQGQRLSKAAARVQAINEYNLAIYAQKQSQKQIKPKVSRKGMPRAPQSEFSKVFSPFTKRLGVSGMKKKGTSFIGLEDPTLGAKLQQLSGVLTSMGLGMYDLESGEGFFSDLYDGAKQVGRTALHMAPHLLPYML